MRRLSFRDFKIIKKLWKSPTKLGTLPLKRRCGIDKE